MLCDVCSFRACLLYKSEFCSGRVSIKLLRYYTFVENILVEGEARNKHGPVNERKSGYTRDSLIYYKVTVREKYLENGIFSTSGKRPGILWMTREI